jgi:hypothetical protein
MPEMLWDSISIRLGHPFWASIVIFHRLTLVAVVHFDDSDYYSTFLYILSVPFFGFILLGASVLTLLFYRAIEKKLQIAGS